MLDIDEFEERAAIAEYCGGLSRFQAETLAAKEQGMSRWEAMNAIRVRNSEQSRDQRQAGNRDTAGHLPAVQSAPQAQDGQVPVGDVQAGRRCVALPPLRV